MKNLKIEVEREDDGTGSIAFIFCYLVGVVCGIAVYAIAARWVS